jgi:hypothetical protein
MMKRGLKLLHNGINSEMVGREVQRTSSNFDSANLDEEALKARESSDRNNPRPFRITRFG